MSGNWQETEQKTVTVASGTGITTSGTVDISEYAHIGMLIPVMTGATGSISFDVSDNSGNFYRLKGTDATEIKLPVGTGSYCVSQIEQIAPFMYVRCVVSATQAAARTLTFILKS